MMTPLLIQAQDELLAENVEGVRLSYREKKVILSMGETLQ
jgi:hypothetical protein